MDKRRLLKRYVYVLFFLAGFFGGFRFIKEFLHPKIPSNIDVEILVYIGVLMVSIYVFKDELLKDIKSYKKIDLNEIVTIFLIITVIAAFFSMFMGKNQPSLQNGQQSIPKLIVMSVMMAPILEEIFNRYGLMDILEKHVKVKNSTIIVLVAMIFALFHIVKKNVFFSFENFRYFLIIFWLGVGCGYLYKKSNNILSAIIMHMLWNFSIVLGYVLVCIVSFVI